MFGAFSMFRFQSTKLLRNTPARAVLASVEAKKLAVYFIGANAQCTLFDPKVMFGAFLKFWFRLTKLVQNLAPMAVLATVEAKKLQLIFFGTNAPDSPHLTQNSCLVHF
jgi:hypothetical protein